MSNVSMLLYCSTKIASHTFTTKHLSLRFRYYHACGRTKQSDGSDLVMVAGGMNVPNGEIPSVEMYDAGIDKVGQQRDTGGPNWALMDLKYGCVTIKQTKKGREWKAPKGKDLLCARMKGDTGMRKE